MEPSEQPTRLHGGGAAEDGIAWRGARRHPRSTRDLPPRSRFPGEGERRHCTSTLKTYRAPGARAATALQTSSACAAGSSSRVAHTQPSPTHAHAHYGWIDRGREIFRTGTHTRDHPRGVGRGRRKRRRHGRLRVGTAERRRAPLPHHSHLLKPNCNTFFTLYSAQGGRGAEGVAAAAARPARCAVSGSTRAHRCER